MAIVLRPNIKETTATVGTGVYSLLGPAVGFFSFLSRIGAGNQAPIVVSNGTDKEFLLGQVVAGSPVTITRVTIYDSTNGGAAVSWGAGTKDIYVDDLGFDRVLALNNLSDLPDPAAAAQTLGLRPAGQAGGSDGKVVRLTTTANTWADAANTDTVVQLAALCFKSGGRYLPPGSTVSGLSGLAAQTAYFLGTAGALTATAPPPSPTVRRVFVGVALSATSLLFTPGAPIGG